MGNHRYILHRRWIFSSNPNVVNFIMLNPSTADDVFDDAMIRRCVGFSKLWNFSALVVTNLFAYRATDPRELKKLAKANFALAVGGDNDAHIFEHASNSNAVVCAWGDNAGDRTLIRRATEITAVLREQFKLRLLCIRLTKQGNPVHPVREPYGPFVEFNSHRKGAE